VTELSRINIRSWYYTGENALLDLVQGSAAGAVCDGRNKPSQEEIQDGCYGIITAKHTVGGRHYLIAQLVRLTGFSRKAVSDIWTEWHGAKESAVVYDMVPITKPMPIDEIAPAMCMSGLALDDRAAVFDYLMGKF
jgi:hypothetical protein